MFILAQCTAQLNMNGVIQVGDNLPNKEQAEKVVKDLEKKSMTNKRSS